MFRSSRLHTVLICLLWCLWMTFVWHPAASAMQGDHFVLNPKKYTSPSGEYTLSVDPNLPYGVGAATYRLYRKAILVWEGTHPFALWNAEVADDGTVAGYAYSNGLDGMGSLTGYPGDLEVIVLNPAGQIRLHQHVPRTNRYLHMLPDPVAVGLIVDSEQDRLIVRVAGVEFFDVPETWWIYRLSTGQEQTRFVPKEKMEARTLARSIIAARPVRGTPLTLIHWWRFADDHFNDRKNDGKSGLPFLDKTMGACFTLIDQEGNPVWRLDLPEDYRYTGDSSKRQIDKITEEGAILPSRQPGRFALISWVRKQVVTFAVTSDKSGEWQVAEVGRKPYRQADESVAHSTVRTVHLKLRDTIRLNASGLQTPSAIRKVWDLVAAGPNRLAFLRQERTTDLVVVNDLGEVVHTLPLERLRHHHEDSFFTLVWQGDDRFVVFVGRHLRHNAEAYIEAYRLNAASGSMSKIEHFLSAYIEGLTRLPDGGFALLSRSDKTPYDSRIQAFDRRGRPTWRIPDPHNPLSRKDPGALFISESLTVLRDGRLAVVDSYEHTVQFFNLRGKYLDTVSLDKAWGHRAEYPCYIVATPDGGFVVRDGSFMPSYYQMDAQGKLVTRFTPRYANDKLIETTTIVVSPDGGYWTTDSYSIFGLDGRGKAIVRLGEAPQPSQLQAIGELLIRPDGSILALDERTDAVHVFDAKGTWLHVCVPGTFAQEAPSMFSMFSMLQSKIQCGPAGMVSTHGRWFDAEGHPCEAPRDFIPVEQRVHALKRRPNNSWMESVHGHSVAPTGALAIVDSNSFGLRSEGAFLSLYPASGSASESRGTTVRLPDEVDFYASLAFDGVHAILKGAGLVFCFDINGKLLWAFKLPLPRADEHGWTPFLTEAGRTLCLFDGERTIYRYAMP